MKIFGQEITREQMPSYDNFRTNPTHLYQLKQESLARLISQNSIMQTMQQPSNATAVTQSERWSNQNGNK